MNILSETSYTLTTVVELDSLPTHTGPTLLQQTTSEL